jgi:hypothetical protein
LYGSDLAGLSRILLSSGWFRRTAVLSTHSHPDINKRREGNQMNPSMMFVHLHQPTSKTGRWLLIIGVLVLIAIAAFLLLHPVALQAEELLAGGSGDILIGST